MTNLEHFKRRITKDNICDNINCAVCPFHKTINHKKPCTEMLKEWCVKEYKMEAK